MFKFFRFDFYFHICISININQYRRVCISSSYLLLQYPDIKISNKKFTKTKLRLYEEAKTEFVRDAKNWLAVFYRPQFLGIYTFLFYADVSA